MTRYTASFAGQNYNQDQVTKVLFFGEINISTNIIITAAIVVILLAAILLYRWFRYTRHGEGRCRSGKKLLAKPFPPEWIEIIQKNVPIYNRLPGPLKNQLHHLVLIFLHKKNFEGCGGLKITDEIKVTIASQACMLLLNRKRSVFKKLHTILVYPETYVVKTTSSDGVIYIEGHSVRLGESWQNGPVVLAWDSIKGRTSEFRDSQNVILHEFAHQLDQEDGSADGTPILENRSQYITWARILSREYESLRKKEKSGITSFIDSYGATNPAEFFAVITEAFFENPKTLKAKHPELYKELSNYYNLNPAEWF